MRSKVSLAVAGGIVFAGLAFSAAFAWTFSIQERGVCQPDGSYQITWILNNSTENEPLKISASSNPLVVPVGTEVGSHKTKAFNQVVDGTKPGKFSLSLTGNWNGDEVERQRTAHKYVEACPQPQPTPPPVITPPEGGRGGGSTVPVVTPTPAPVPAPTPAPVQTPQVVVPVGAVHAGNGGAKVLSLGALTGLIGSAIAMGFGALRLSKKAL